MLSITTENSTVVAHSYAFVPVKNIILRMRRQTLIRRKMHYCGLVIIVLILYVCTRVYEPRRYTVRSSTIVAKISIFLITAKKNA